MDFIWNETLGEQIRAESERTMQMQLSDIRNAVDAFNAAADATDAAADAKDAAADAADASADAALASAASISASSDDSPDGSGSAGRAAAAAEAAAAAAAARAQAAAMRAEATAMRAQAAEVRAAAAAMSRAANALESAIGATNVLFRRLFEETQNIDANSAARMMEIKTDIASYLNMMQGIRDSFGGSVSSSTDATYFTVSDVSRIMSEAINATALDGLRIDRPPFHPTLHDVMSGIQAAASAVLDPINAATGNFYYEKEDISIPGRNPLVFKRFYNAQSSIDSVMGKKWTHSYNIQLYNYGEKVHIVFGDGHVETYTQLEAGFYAAPSDKHNVLTIPEGDIGGFDLYFQTPECYHFNDSGLLCSITDGHGHETAFEYESGLLKQVKNMCGSLSFEYNEDGHLTTASDHTGREALFEYEEGQLTKATHPGGAVHKYEYESPGMLSKIIDPQGEVAVYNEYDSEGRTIVQHLANGGVSGLEYNDNERTNTTTELNGNRVMYYRDDAYRTTKVVYADFEERYEYDSQSGRTGHTDRNGNTWWYEFDVYGNTTKKTDPLGNVVSAKYNEVYSL